MAELVCPLHGPYNAALGRCPVCAGEPGRPAAPRPLDEDDMPTNIGGGQRAAPMGGGGLGGWPQGGDEEPTDMGFRQHRRGILDDEEETEMPGRGHYDMDETVLDHPVEGLQAILWVKNGRRRGRIYKVTDGMLIGRKNCDLVLDEDNVSGQHAKIAIRGDEVVLLDLLSKNGTYVDEEKISGATELKENSTIKIGSTTFVIKILEN